MGLERGEEAEHGREQGGRQRVLPEKGLLRADAISTEQVLLIPAQCLPTTQVQASVICGGYYYYLYLTAEET